MSNVQNPTSITYNEIGTYDVTLTVTNSNGQTETLTKQNYITVSEWYNMQNTTITTCNAMFYDDGGPNNNYGNNKTLTMTFLPTGEGRKIRVNFTEFSTEADYDFLYIYDGNSASSPQIGKYDGNNSPGAVTATNNEGALTFRFTSDQGVTSSGWVAQVSCIYDNPLIIMVTATPEIINEGETSQLSVVAMGGAGNYTYQWDPAETLDNPTSANPIATPVDAETTYKVAVTDSEGNQETGAVTVTIRNWSTSENEMRNTKISPNPNNGVFTIETGGEFTYELFNHLGQRVLQGKADDKVQVEAQGLNPGIYFLRFKGEQENGVEKIIIK